MRPALVAALGIVAVLIATSLLVPGLGRSEAVTPGHSAAPAIPAVTVRTTNSVGSTSLTYVTGLSSGRVFFAVTDTSADTKVTVSIFDHNATRDSLPSPVKTWSAPIAAGANSSYLWNIYYLLPVTLIYGGEWNITVNGTLGGFAYQNFTVRTYGVESALSPRAGLPAENVSAAVLLDSFASGAPYTHVTDVVVTGDYFTTSATLSKLSKVSLGAIASGYDNFTVPSDALGTLSLTIYANTSSGGFNVSAVTSTSMYVGHLTAPVVTLSSCPSGCPTSTFDSGAPVYVSVTELISGTTSPAPGMSVGFQYEKGSSFVTPPGNPPATVLTDGLGHASVTFLASTSVFSTTGLNTVVVTVTDPVDRSLTSQNTNASFTIVVPTTVPTVLVTWSNSEYYSGATASFHWALGGQNASAASGWSGGYWLAEGVTGTNFLKIGQLPSGATSGTVNVAIPAGFLGEMEAYVTASNSTDSTGSYALAAVEAGTILLTPNEDVYLPGDTVKIAVATDGPALSGATLWATVQDSAGNWIQNSAVSGGSISISVPSNTPPTYYTVAVVAQTATGGTIANASVTVEEASGVDLALGISTASNYLDGSYQPGETVTVTYTFTARGVASLPQTYVLVLTPSTSQGTGYSSQQVDVSGSSGSFQYTIPHGAPNGLLMVTVDATLGGARCVSYCHTSSQFTANVNGNPAALAYQFGNSGVTLGAVIAIVVLLLLALIVVLVMRRRGRMGGRPMMMKPESTSGGSSGSASGSSTSSSSGGGSSPPSNP